MYCRGPGPLCLGPTGRALPEVVAFCVAQLPQSQLNRKPRYVAVLRMRSTAIDVGYHGRFRHCCGLTLLYRYGTPPFCQPVLYSRSGASFFAAPSPWAVPLLSVHRGRRLGLGITSVASSSEMLMDALVAQRERRLLGCHLGLNICMTMMVMMMSWCWTSAASLRRR